MTDPLAINLLPASGEWVYDTLPRRATMAGASAPTLLNLNAAPGGTRTDYSLAIDQLQAQVPGCRTVSLVVAWFGNSTDVTQCAIYPTTNYSGGTSAGPRQRGLEPRPLALLRPHAGLRRPDPAIDNRRRGYVYGGTPSDGSIVRCIRDLKARGLRVTFYPFILMDAPGYPWRGRIGYNGADISQAATNAVTAFLGPAAPAQFTRDTTNLTVAYSGAAADYTYRRMILHYANLCVIAGGVDLFLIGSELRVASRRIRGPGLDQGGHGRERTARRAGTIRSSPASAQLADDVRGGLRRGAGLTRDTVNLHNLIAYSADWSDWMGFQHPGANGQWPHLDSLYACASIDLVSFDNYLPLSDWTSTGGLDVVNWSGPTPTSWPPTAATMNGLGLTGLPSLHAPAYLKANIEGGEKFDWFYADSNNLGHGLDPAGSDLQVSRPEGDRLGQSRTPYLANQQLLANKQVRWWWANPHYAIYDAGDGLGYVPHGSPTAWVPQAKSITFAEYGFPTCDRCTNQPNVFYDPKSSESFTPYWSAWDSAEGATLRPRRDDLLASLARSAVVEYWTSDGHNATSAAGLPMIQTTFMAAWNWDARPFPAFPMLGLWGDAPNWATGTWVGGKGPALPPASADPAPILAPYPPFPTLAGQGWSTTYRPSQTTGIASHVSGRESRAGRVASPGWSVDLTFDVLSDAVRRDIEALAGFYEAQGGGALPFLLAVPAELGLGPSLACRFVEDQLDLEAFTATLIAVRTLTLQSVK